MRLTAKQRRFVEEYTRDFNATQAALRAGYSSDTAGAIGSENLTKPNIAAAVKERMDELSMSADEALLALTEIARGSIEDCIEIQPGGGWRLDLAKAKQAGKLKLVHELSHDANGLPKLKMYNRHEAIRDIAKARGVFVDKVEHSGTDGGPIEMKITHRVIDPASD